MISMIYRWSRSNNNGFRVYIPYSDPKNLWTGFRDLMNNQSGVDIGTLEEKVSALGGWGERVFDQKFFDQAVLLIYIEDI